MRATPRRGRWDRLALTGLEDDLSWHPARPYPGGELGRGGRRATPRRRRRASRLGSSSKVQGLRRYRALLEELRQVPEPDLAMLSVAVRTLAELVPRGLDT